MAQKLSPEAIKETRLAGGKRMAAAAGGLNRDKTYSISGDLIYKMNRNLWVKGTLRRDWLDSNLPGNSTNSTVVMLGVRLQH